LTLVNPSSEAFVSSTVSAVDGSYSFDEIDRSQTFDVIAIDPNQKWEKRISSRRVPYWKDPVLNFDSGDGTEARAVLSRLKKTGKFWRIFIEDSAETTNSSISELEMFELGGSTNLCVGGTPSADTEYNSSWQAAFAFDGIKGGNTGWSALGSLPHWLQYEFTDTVSIGKIGITARDPGNGNTYAPLIFNVQASDDGVIWEDIWTVVTE